MPLSPARSTGGRRRPGGGIPDDNAFAGDVERHLVVNSGYLSSSRVRRTLRITQRFSVDEASRLVSSVSSCAGPLAANEARRLVYINGKSETGMN